MGGDPVAGTSGGVGNPDTVQTLSELAAAFNQLRGDRSYADIDRAARPQRLPASTLSNLLRGTSVPTRDTIVTFLTACGLDREEQGSWLAAWERVSRAHLRRPVGAARVRDARPRLLGVHTAIRVADARSELPVYVPRDLDADLRTAITAAAEDGGFVLLVGGPSVGKTRALFEALRVVLPEWWLLHPTDTDAVRTFADTPTPRTVLWLDELQRYFSHPGGLPAGVVRGMITARTVLVATLWPDECTTRTAPRAPGQTDPYANDRDLLGIAWVVDVPDTFTTAERRRAQALVATDPRIRLALDTPDAGFTQVLVLRVTQDEDEGVTDDEYGSAGVWWSR
jgi:hypothetical protein